MSKYFNLISFMLILFSAFLSAQVTVQVWVGQLGDGARVEFQQAFSQVPIVFNIGSGEWEGDFKLCFGCDISRF